MANTLTFDQLATVLNAVVEQATGRNEITPINTGEFVAVGQKALLTGYDPLNTAISQVLAKTIFSTRPYYAKFRGLEVDNQKWGNMVRKLTMIDPKFRESERYTLQDGVSVDQQIVCAPKALQLNFYGAEAYDLCRTVYRDQLDSAMTGPDEFGRFIAMLMQNASDVIEQSHEATARLTLANYITGIIAENSAERVVHLVTEYNAYIGGSYTSATIKAPDVYPAFVKWTFGRIASISSMLTERSELFHTNLTGSPVSRHTPYDRQRVYLLASERYGIEAQVFADTYHDNYLRWADNETVNFWQSIRTPGTITATPTYLLPDGSLTTPEDAVSATPVFGVIMDTEAAGLTIMSQWAAAAPFNARGGYTTYWWHFTDKYWNDFTENGVVLLMD